MSIRMVLSTKGPHFRSLASHLRPIGAIQWRCNCSTVSAPASPPKAAPGGGLRNLAKKGNAKPKARELLPSIPARTRFAPSPTGYLHLGSLRTALYNWLLAKATGGQFIIRIEDTDQSRLVGDSIPRLLRDLKWANIDWDEGPGNGGPYGPYVQSERLLTYRQHADVLLEKGHAYRCFCTAEQLERHAQAASDAGGASHGYPGTCRSIPAEEAQERALKGEKHIIRFRSRGRPEFHDLVYGLYRKNEDEPDFILIKTDGYPTYHFANVVDDHLMKITHVIRGVEWLISTPKHIALYDAFGWKPPTFGHVGLLCGTDGEKLSKRSLNDEVDVAAYRNKGFVPSALNNWLALLGWRPEKSKTKRDNEFFPSLKELAERFSTTFTKGNAQINPSKLMTLNRRHTFQMLSDPQTPASDIVQLFVQPLLDNIAAIEQQRIPDILSSATSPSPQLEFISPDDLECLVPELQPLHPRTEDATAHLITGLRSLASDNKEMKLDITQLLTSHPTFFFRPKLDTSSQSSQDLLASIKKQSPEISSRIDSVVADLRSLSTCAEETAGAPQWTSESIGQLLTKHARASASPEQSKMLYDWLRLALTGTLDVPGRPSKMQLAFLGREESLLRLERLQRAMD